MPPTTALDTRAAPDARDRRLLGAFCDQVLAAFPDRIERIVLFGSRARGDPEADSDWDFAVFFDREPGEDEVRHLRELSWKLGDRYAADIQAWAFPPGRWLDTDELACNVREYAIVLFGSPEVPMVERPVLQHAQDALEKAERFAQNASKAAPDRYEVVMYTSYYAMFHAARAALLAAEGSASTKHGRVVEAFSRMVRRRDMERGVEHATALETAFELRIEADYANKDLTEAARELRDRVGPFLAFCRELVEREAGRA